MNSGANRQIYLLKTLGLSHDPFDGPVAEQELHSSDKEPHFFAYYTDPQSTEENKPLPQLLRKARNGLIFGPPGSGKTTLRYTLEAECRSVFDRTLVVTYELSHKLASSPPAETHWTNIAKELAIDLVIQVIEQLDTFEPPTAAQKQQLQDQMGLVWPRLRRTVELILSDDYVERENGLGSLWPRLNRPAVRYIYPSAKINQLLQEYRPKNNQPVEPPAGELLLRSGLTAAKAWGFRQIFVLVDGVDAQERDRDHMLALITSLLDNLAYWQSQGLYFYFFLPEELQSLITENYGHTLSHLPAQPFFHIIRWDQEYLAELLHQRLRAAGSRVPGFNALAAAELANRLEDYLIQAAHNSPRNLLRTVSALIDAHAQRQPDQPLLTPADWHTMKQNWSYGLPIPLDITANGFYL